MSGRYISAFTAKRSGRAGGEHDQAADCGTEAARDVVTHGGESNRSWQLLWLHLFADGRLPRRAVQRDADANQRAETKQHPRRRETEQGNRGQRRRADRCEGESAQRDLAPVEHIRDGAGRHGHEHQRQHQRGLHQRHHAGRRGESRHLPRGADALNQLSEVGEDAGRPDAPERAFTQRLECGPTLGGGCVVCDRHASTTGVLTDLPVDEVEHRVVERIVGVAGDHVMRAGDVDELGVRHHLEELTCAFLADDTTPAASHEQGGDVDGASKRFERIRSVGVGVFPANPRPIRMNAGSQCQ